MSPNPGAARYEIAPDRPAKKPEPAIETEKDISKEAADAAALFSGEKNWYAYRNNGGGIVEPFCIQVLGLKEIHHDQTHRKPGDTLPTRITTKEIRDLVEDKNIDADTIINRKSVMAILEELKKLNP